MRGKAFLITLLTVEVIGVLIGVFLALALVG